MYITADIDRHVGLLKQCGRHKAGKSYVYMKRLSDVNQGVLRVLSVDAVRHMRDAHHPG